MMGATEFESVVGLEVHAQLLTRSKMFCGCSADYSGAPPNTHTCSVCTGMPGSLPVINARAVEHGLVSALALNCDVPLQSKFDRKNYSYPDLPKGYQISQYDEPIGTNGQVEYRVDGRQLQWGIVRVHLEEDTGKSLHSSAGGPDVSRVDYNRSGIPLMEIVTTPEVRSPLESREFFVALRQILMYLGVSNGNLQEGSLRVDVNISMRRPGGPLGTKVEIKNLNSFRALERSLEHEMGRQIQILGSGGEIVQETRGWLEADEVTVSQRTKEYAHDYRYFPEPDLPPLALSAERLQSLRSQVPELPVARGARLQREYCITSEHAHVLTLERPLAEFFEEAARAAPSTPPRLIANWITGDVLRLLNESGESIGAPPVSADRLGELVALVHGGEISGAAAKQVLEAMFTSGEDAEAVVERLNLRQLADADELERLVQGVIAGNPKLVADLKKGKNNTIQALIGQCMKASQGRAHPQHVQDILRRQLA